MRDPRDTPRVVRQQIERERETESLNKRFEKNEEEELKRAIACKLAAADAGKEPTYAETDDTATRG